MCNLAGYTGSKRAAPILIDMLRRQQFYDGGVCTGIATIHEGKLYIAKAVGDVDALLETTDALNLPGTIGIAHSRPCGKLVNQEHPFTDNSGRLALALNGTMRDVDVPEFFDEAQRIMQGFLDRGFEIKSAIPENGKYRKLSNGMAHHDTEPYALMTGDMYDSGTDFFEALAKSLSALPADIVTIAIHTDKPDTIAIGRITRPMAVGICGDETYISTTEFGFPENVKFNAVMQAPEGLVSYVRPGKFTVTNNKVENVNVQPLTPDIFAKAYNRVEKILSNEVRSLYDLPVYEMKDLWDEPYVDCKFAKDGGLLKPYGTMAYQILWAFHLEGRLHKRLSDRHGIKKYDFWIDKE